MPTLKGNIIGANSRPLAYHTILIVAAKTSQTVLNSADGYVQTDDKGAYEFYCQPGEYLVYITHEGRQSTLVGKMKIYSDSPDGTLNDYLAPINYEELTPELERRVLAIIASARNDMSAEVSKAQQFSNQSKSYSEQSSSHSNDSYASSQQAKAYADSINPDLINQNINSKAAKGENSDITKLKGLVKNGDAWVEEADLSAGEGEAGINLVSNNAIGVSFGTESTNGGASVFHNFTKGPGGTQARDKSIIGGYGSRPFNGVKYSAHSNSAIHFMQDGDASPTNEGGWLRLLVTPKGKTVSSRFASFLLSNNGDTYIGKDIHPDGFDGTQYQYNFTDFNGRGLKQVINNVNELHLVSGVTAGSSCSGNVRFNACGGSPLNPGPVQGGSSMYFSFSGFDGSSWSSAGALMQIQAVSTWSPTNRGSEITFATTPAGSITRFNRWLIQNDGILAPAFDNNVSIGWSQKRITSLYANNGTVQTSDGRLKTPVREFTDNEINASCAISKEIGFWQWKEKLKEEGENARIHVGMTVQRAIEIMESFELDPMKYGFICYDSWDESNEVTHCDGDGNEVRTFVAAGDRYSFRYDQLNLFIAKGIDARLSKIEESLK